MATKRSYKFEGCIILGCNYEGPKFTEHPSMEFPNTLGQGMVQTFFLSSFLGTAWLTDEHIDAMMEELQTKVGVASNVQIATLSFSTEIKKLDPKAKLSDAPQKKRLLSQYEQQVHENDLKKLAFPIHVSQNHWVAGLIDFDKKILSFGNSPCRVLLKYVFTMTRIC